MDLATKTHICNHRDTAINSTLVVIPIRHRRRAQVARHHRPQVEVHTRVVATAIAISTCTTTTRTTITRIKHRH